ncbi:flagellar hook-length control protein FliK [Buchnera aphidicola]|nr:flagellar hook-length control protein FliK [Buchnera aphidicola]
MSEIIYNITSQKNSFFHKDNYFNIVNESDLSNSVFNKLNKYLLQKEMEFDNVSTEEKKNDEKKNIVCANFIINNLLNIFNKKDIIFNSKNFNDIQNNKIQKKKIEKNQNNFSDTICFLKIIKNFKNKNIQEIFKILKIKRFPSELKKSNNQFNGINELNNIDIKKNLHLKNSNYQFFQKKTNTSNINKNNLNLIKNEKKIIFPSDIKESRNTLFPSKNINKIKNIISKRSSLKILNQKEFSKLYVEPLISQQENNSIKWRKLISNKILLSISNKDNQAEIHLKPASLGTIHIIVNMKNNIAKLKFFSKYDEVRKFLDSSIPFLRNSLMRNGIKLEKFNIFDSATNKITKSYKNLLYENIFRSDNSKKRLNIYEKKINLIKYKPIDVYV